jgi:hypothetical protein
VDDGRGRIMVLPLSAPDKGGILDTQIGLNPGQTLISFGALSPNGTQLLYATSKISRSAPSNSRTPGNYQVTVWDTASLKQLETISLSNDLRTLTYSGDGRLILYVAGETGHLLQADSLKEVRTVNLRYVQHVALSATGKHLAVADMFTIQVHDLENNNYAEVSGLKNPVDDVVLAGISTVQLF